MKQFPHMDDHLIKVGTAMIRIYCVYGLAKEISDLFLKDAPTFEIASWTLT